MQTGATTLLNQTFQGVDNVLWDKKVTILFKFIVISFISSIIIEMNINHNEIWTIIDQEYFSTYCIGGEGLSNELTDEHLRWVRKLVMTGIFDMFILYQKAITHHV